MCLTTYQLLHAIAILIFIETFVPDFFRFFVEMNTLPGYMTSYGCNIYNFSARISTDLGIPPMTNRKICRPIFTLVMKNLVRLRAIYIKRYIDNKSARISFSNPFIKLKIVKKKNAKLIINGLLTFTNFTRGTDPIVIVLEENAVLNIAGDFTIGSGVRLVVTKNANLRIGGKHLESTSGITANTMVITSKNIEIGKDFLCSWGCTIMDSDWHHIEYDNAPIQIQKDISIGDHVWIGHDCSILKGANIGNGCIVGSKSLVQNKAFPDNSVVAGVPAKIIKKNCNWRTTE